jgi:hypothetical protein
MLRNLVIIKISLHVVEFINSIKGMCIQDVFQDLFELFKIIRNIFNIGRQCIKKF